MGVYLKTLLAVVIVTFADWLLHGTRTQPPHDAP